MASEELAMEGGIALGQESPKEDRKAIPPASQWVIFPINQFSPHLALQITLVGYFIDTLLVCLGLRTTFWFVWV